MARCHAIDNDSGGSHPCHATGGVCEAARGRERQKHEELFLETLSRVTILWLLHLRLWDCKGAASYRESRWQTWRQRSLISWAESSTLFGKKKKCNRCWIRNGGITHSRGTLIHLQPQHLLHQHLLAQSSLHVGSTASPWTSSWKLTPPVQFASQQPAAPAKTDWRKQRFWSKEKPRKRRNQGFCGWTGVWLDAALCVCVCVCVCLGSFSVQMFTFCDSWLAQLSLSSLSKEITVLLKINISASNTYSTSLALCKRKKKM